MDQLRKQFDVYWVMGRDLHPNGINEMVTKLGDWCINAEDLMSSLVCVMIQTAIRLLCAFLEVTLTNPSQCRGKI